MTERKTGLADPVSPAVRERCAFMALPLDERRRRMAEQASQIVAHYEERAECIEREAWQGGDIVEGT